MKYIVNLRWNNPGVAKYLIDSWQFNEFMDAFHHAKSISEKLDSEHFVEIVQDNEKIAGFNEKAL